MKVGVMGNGIKVKNTGIAERFIRFLENEGYKTVLFNANEEIDEVDVLIVLGGDGAILHAAKTAALKKIKVIGINYGTLGFLTEYEKQETEQVKTLLAELKEDKCPILKRSMLEVDFQGKKYYALNEVAIQRDYTAFETQIVKIEVQINGRSMETIGGDGVLLCTPTGSTAYSLSAGGAILTPEVPAFLLTWICAFSLNARPVVFPDTDEFYMSVERGNALLLVDGKPISSITEGMGITVRKAPFSADFPMRGNSCFFKKIRTKLNQ